MSYCIHCHDEVDKVTDTRIKEVLFENKLFMVEDTCCYCARCGYEFIDKNSMSLTMEKAYDLFKNIK